VLRELLLALVLTAGLASTVAGVSLWSIPAALIVAGLGVAALGFLFLAEVGS
jgi:hypothetical protein